MKMQRFFLVGLLALTLSACAGLSPVEQVTATEAKAVSATPAPADLTPLKEMAKVLGVLGDNPILTLANKDAVDTLAWVNGPQGPIDDLAKFRASQCPLAIQKATANLKDKIAMVQGLVTNLDAQLASGLSQPPELILFFTKLRYGPAGQVGSDPKALIASMQHDIFERVTAVVDSCRAVIPAKQMNALAMDAAKLGGITLTGGAAGPLMGLLP